MPDIANPAIIGVLGLGQMGAGVAANLKANGFDVVSTLEGRSERSRERAAQAGVRILSGLGDVVAVCDTFLSIVAADQAEPLADGVAACIGNHPLHFVDCNSITPSRTLRIAQRVQEAGATFSDGGIIGPPPGGRVMTRLYVSGPVSETLVALQNDQMSVTPLGEGMSKATEMKVLFAAANKGVTALLANVMAAAKEVGLTEQLTGEIDAFRPGLLDFVRGAGPGLIEKAARWSIEMEDLAEGLAEMHVDGGYHAAAAESYRRLAENLETMNPYGDPLTRVLDAWIRSTPA